MQTFFLSSFLSCCKLLQKATNKCTNKRSLKFYILKPGTRLIALKIYDVHWLARATGSPLITTHAHGWANIRLTKQKGVATRTWLRLFVTVHSDMRAFSRSDDNWRAPPGKTLLHVFFFVSRNETMPLIAVGYENR